jgi:hypothetical protein
MEMWRILSISQEELDQEGVYAIERLKINDVTINNWRNELRYAYTIEVPEKIYKKIYTPFSQEKQFKWISNIPLHIPFGITNLPRKSNQLIVCKSQKERLLFKKFFTDVIALQAENPFALNERTEKFIRKHYDRALLFFDCDDAGIKSSKHFIQRGFTPYWIPPDVQEEQGLKDWAEFVGEWGLEAMELYLKHLKLL